MLFSSIKSTFEKTVSYALMSFYNASCGLIAVSSVLLFMIDLMLCLCHTATTHS